MTNEIEHSTPNHEKHQCNHIYRRFCTDQFVGESNTEKTANILSVMNI